MDKAGKLRKKSFYIARIVIQDPVSNNKRIIFGFKEMLPHIGQKSIYTGTTRRGSKIITMTISQHIPELRIHKFYFICGECLSKRGHLVWQAYHSGNRPAHHRMQHSRLQRVG